MIASFCSLKINGENGERYGLLYTLILASFVIKRIKPINIPNIPKRDARIIKIIRHHLIAEVNSIEVNTNPEIADIAITIIIIGDIIPADTAASPSTKPPNIDTAVPMVDAIRISLSLNISKEMVISSASTKAGKGTVCLCDKKFNNKSIVMES